MVELGNAQNYDLQIWILISLEKKSWQVWIETINRLEGRACMILHPLTELESHILLSFQMTPSSLPYQNVHSYLLFYLPETKTHPSFLPTKYFFNISSPALPTGWLASFEGNILLFLCTLWRILLIRGSFNACFYFNFCFWIQSSIWLDHWHTQLQTWVASRASCHRGVRKQIARGSTFLHLMNTLHQDRLVIFSSIFSSFFFYPTTYYMPITD